MKIVRYNRCMLLLTVLAALLIGFGACKKYNEHPDVILITGTETGKIVKFTVASVPSSFGVTATATGKVAQDVTVNFDIDTTLIKAYNLEVSGSYYAAPAGSYALSGKTGVISAGTNVSSPVSIQITSIANFIDGRNYVIPVTITSVTGPLAVLEPSRTIFLKVARVSKFNSVDISNYNFYDSDTFPTPLTNITAFTFEIKCYVNSWHTGSPPISRVCNWGPADQTTFNLLRFGESGSQQNQLQWINSSGSCFSNTLFSLNRWYTISCTYDGLSCKLYIDGVLDNSFDAAGQAYVLGALELGMSYAGYQNAQRFLGRIAEIRFWNRPLSSTELQNNICGVDAAASGLVSYWKLNEGTGQTFYDRTGHGRDMLWRKAAVVWNSDSTNKCAQ